MYPFAQSMQTDEVVNMNVNLLCNFFLVKLYGFRNIKKVIMNDVILG